MWTFIWNKYEKQYAENNYQKISPNTKKFGNVDLKLYKEERSLKYVKLQ